MIELNPNILVWDVERMPLLVDELDNRLNPGGGEPIASTFGELRKG